jgi:hypothetical protein
MSRRTRPRVVLAAVLLGGMSPGPQLSTLSAQRGAQVPAAPAAVQQEGMPALLFREVWRQADAAVGVPSSPRRSSDKYWLASQSAVTNPNLEVKFYGTDARNITVYLHENRYDLWTGLTGSPVAVLLKHKASYMDLTGLARVRAIVRTGNLHTLHSALKLADGTLVAGSHAIDTDGQFLQVEASFANQKWYVVEPDSLGVKSQAMKVDLARVDEVGFVDLAPAGGHGSSGWANVSSIEVYAKAVPR